MLTANTDSANAASFLGASQAAMNSGVVAISTPMSAPCSSEAPEALFSRPDAMFTRTLHPTVNGEPEPLTAQLDPPFPGSSDWMPITEIKPSTAPPSLPAHTMTEEGDDLGDLLEMFLARVDHEEIPASRQPEAAAGLQHWAPAAQESELPLVQAPRAP